MQYTDKLNLSKPDGSDYVEVQVLSENFQKIDDAIENDLTATEQGHILDARQGKVLNDNKAERSELGLQLMNLGSIGSSNSIDLDDYYNSSMYCYWTSANKGYVSNKPEDGAGACFTVAGKNGRTFQFAYSSNFIWLRIYGASSWADWHKIVHKETLVERVEVSNSTSIAANSVKYFDLTTTKTGYTPIGIVAVTGSGTTGLVLQEYFLRDTTAKQARIYFRNATNSAITPSKIQADILYESTSYV